MRKEPRSNFARMDEMEEKENLQSKKTLFETRRPWHYHGPFFRLLRKQLGVTLNLLCLKPKVLCFVVGVLYINMNVCHKITYTSAQTATSILFAMFAARVSVS